MEKLLLHRKVGNYGAIFPSQRFVRRFKASEPSGGYLNILILGDGYTKGDQRRFWQDRYAVIRTIYSTFPFSALRHFINVYSHFDESVDSGVPTGTPGNTFYHLYIRPGSKSTFLDMDGAQTLFDHVALLEHKKLGVSGGTTWLDGPQRGFLAPQNGINPSGIGNKSFGCIGIIGRSNQIAGEYLASERTGLLGIDNIAHPGGDLAFFAAIGTDSKEIAQIFLHELCHSLGLADEYEEDEYDTATQQCKSYDYTYYPGAATEQGSPSSTPYSTDPALPNIVRRWELLSPGDRTSDDMKRPLAGSNLPTVAPADFKWRDLMNDTEINNFRSLLNPHPNWTTLLECQTRPDPSFSKESEEIRLVEGADHYRRNIFRSADTCIMRQTFEEYPILDFSLSNPESRFEQHFCKVCRYWLMRVIMS